MFDDFFFKRNVTREVHFEITLIFVEVYYDQNYISLKDSIDN